MKRQPPPLRFIAAVVGLWICARTALLAPSWWVEQRAAAPAMPGAPTRSTPAIESNAATAWVPHVPNALQGADRLLSPVPIARPARDGAAASALVLPIEQVSSLSVPPSRKPAALLPLPRAERLRRGASDRWSGSAWLLLRDDRSPALAPGGTLGGSQTGVRFAYRLNRDPARPLALGARLYAPIRSPSGAEAALGLEWQPLAGVPVHMLAERRQRLGRDGRSAFALAVHGGIAERRLPGGVTLDAYAQAGVVGTRSRDLFVDGAALLNLPVGGVRIGAGVWGGAQPGASRLDAGPQASVRVPLAGEAVRLSAEWRFRIAGDANPASGPVLTLGSDF